MPSVLSLWIFKTASGPCNALDFPGAVLQLPRHQQIENSDNCQGQKIVDGRLDCRDVPDWNDTIYFVLS